MNTQAVVFDKDGTLLDFDKFWVPVTVTAIKDVLGENYSSELETKMLESIGVKNGVSDITGKLCCDTYEAIASCFYGVLCQNGIKTEKSGFPEKVTKAFHDGIESGIVAPICESLTETLEKLKDNDIKVAIVTTDDFYTTEKCLEKLGIKQYFDAVYTDDGKIPTKPSPEALYDFCERFGVDKENIVMVGDTLTDMRFAKNSEVRAVGVAKTESNKNVLMTMTNTVIHDVSYIFDVID